jgi:hypothetical protein
MRPLLLLLLMSCAPRDPFEVWELADVPQAGPPLPHTLSLFVPRGIIPGGQLEVMVRGATPGGQVILVISDGGLGRGACPPALQGGCLEIRAGHGYRRLVMQANARGEARLREPVPPWLSGTWAFQAVDPAQRSGSAPQEFAVAVAHTGDTASPFLQAEAIYMSATFAYDPATDAAVGWFDAPGQPERRPRLDFIIGTEDGVMGDPDEACMVTLEAPGPVSRAPWATPGIAHLFGLDFDPAQLTPVVHDCGALIDRPSVDTMVQGFVNCQTWGVSIDAGVGPEAARLLPAAGIPLTDFLGASYHMNLACGWPDPTSEGYAFGTALQPGRVVDPLGTLITGAARTTTHAAGHTVPAEGLWSVASLYLWTH